MTPLEDLLELTKAKAMPENAPTLRTAEYHIGPSPLSTSDDRSFPDCDVLDKVRIC